MTALWIGLYVLAGLLTASYVFRRKDAPDFSEARLVTTVWLWPVFVGAIIHGAITYAFHWVRVRRDIAGARRMAGTLKALRAEERKENAR